MAIAAQPNAQTLTARDLKLLPESARYELIQGALHEMPPPPGEAHGNTSNRLSFFLNAHIYGYDLGEGFAAETGFLIARQPDTVLAPDFAFVSRERLPAQLATGYLPLAPDLVLETRSPSDREQAVSDKITKWLQAGVRMALELNLKSRVLTVHRPGLAPRTLTVGDRLSGEDVLPGLDLPIRNLFRDAVDRNEKSLPQTVHPNLSEMDDFDVQP